MVRYVRMMPDMTNPDLKIAVLTCGRCLGTWVPRKTYLPKQCAICGSVYWNVPRKYTVTKTAKIRSGKIA